MASFQFGIGIVPKTLSVPRVALWVSWGRLSIFWMPLVSLGLKNIHFSNPAFIAQAIE